MTAVTPKISVRLSPHALGWVVLVLGVVLTALTIFGLNRHQDTVLQQRVGDLAESAETLVRTRFELYQYGLRALRGAIVTTGADRFNRTAFDAYMASRDHIREFPGARGFGFIRKVPLGGEDRFLEQARADGAPDFRIRQLAPHDDELFVIQYLWPQEGNQGAVGLDIGSEANRRQAAVRSAQTNDARLTRPITLVQADGQNRRGFLVMMPVYRAEMRLQSPEDREHATFGWTYAPLVVDEVLDGVRESLREVSLTLTDTEETAPFYTSGVEAKKAESALNAKRSIQISGRTWVLHANALPTMREAAGFWPLSWTAALGLLLSSLVALFAYSRRLRSGLAEPVSTGANHGWNDFVATPWVRNVFVAYVCTALLLLGLGLAYQWQKHVQDAATSVREAAARALEVGVQGSAGYQNAVSFLATTSSTTELIRALSDTPDLANRRNIEAFRTLRTTEELRADVANTFKAFLVSSPAVVQARLISFADGGLELVRVERDGDRLKVVRQQDLQTKGNEPYMLAARDLLPGQTWVSELTLNREYGQVVLPPQPTLRFVAPLFSARNELFGIAILNVDVREMLNDWARLAPPLGVMFAVKSSGDFVLHPDASRTFGIDYDHPYVWDNAFSLAANPWGTDPAGLSTWRSEQGTLLTASADFSPGGTSSTSALRLIAGVPMASVAGRFWQPLVLPFLGLLGFAFASALGLYWRWSQRASIETHLHELAEAERQQKERSLFKGVLESAPEAMLVADAAGTIILANTRMEELFGYTAEALLGRNVELLVPETLASAHRNHVHQFVQTPHPHRIRTGRTLLARRSNSDCFPAEISLGPVEHAGQLLVVASVRDLTRQQEFENLLREARDHAEQANQAKSAFLANMSHEIRTPLNAVIGLTGLLSEDDLSKQQRTYVQKIQLSGRALLGIVNDVLDLAKIEADELSLEDRPCRPAELLERLDSVFGTQAEAKGLDFVLEMDRRLPIWVIADCNRLGQVLTNLLGNALKFTASGQIRLSAEVLDPTGTPDDGTATTVRVKFTVTDSGIGIAPEAQERLFQPFSQADNSTARRFGGTGLGLSIVKRMTDLMHGEVGLDSTPGKGSRFSVTVPLSIANEDQIPHSDEVVDPVHILLAEDNPDERARLTAMTRSLGWHHQTVSNGADLVTALRERVHDGRGPFEAVIVDWQMPEMDGLTALTTVAHELGPEKLPAVLMISAYEQQQIEGLDTEHLVDQFLHKPIDASQLFNAVNDIVTARTGKNMRVLQATRTEAVAARWLPGVRVLVADDSELNLDVVTAILARSGALVTAVTNGKAALDYLNQAPDGVDVVLMDVQMPGMDGLETTRHIRENPALADLPVIALTAGALVEEKRRAHAAGMNDFLTKPVEPAQLIQRVRFAVERYRGQRLPIEPNVRATSAEHQDWPQIDGIDSTAAARLLAGDVELFFATLERLLAPDSTLQLPQADGSADDPAWRRAAAASVHKMRGSAGLIGATRLQQLTAAAESALRSPDQDPQASLAAVRAALDALQTASQAPLAAWHTQRQLTADADVNAQPLDAPALNELATLLEQRDLDALERAKVWAGPLRALLGAETYSQFRVLMDQLNFKQARVLLKFPSAPDTTNGETL